MKIPDCIELGCTVKTEEGQNFLKEELNNLDHCTARAGMKFRAQNEMARFCTQGLADTSLPSMLVFHYKANTKKDLRRRRSWIHVLTTG